MAITHMDGPLVTGTIRESASGVTANTGYVVLSQTKTLTQNSTNAVSQTFTVPAESQIVGWTIYNTAAWNSGTSATLSAGTTAGGTQYITSMDVKTPTGLIPLTATHVTTTQAANWGSVGTNTSVVVTVTPSGATSAGTTVVTLLYAQK